MANATFFSLLRSAGAQVTLIRNAHGLAQVEKKGTAFSALTLASGDRVSAKFFIDCSYEGDTIVRGNLSYAVGREPTSAFNESVAGVQGWPWPHSDPGTRIGAARQTQARFCFFYRFPPPVLVPVVASGA